MKIEVKGKVTAINFDEDGSGQMHVALPSPGPNEGEVVYKGAVTLRLPPEQAGGLAQARTKTVTVTFDIPEEPAAPQK